MAAVGSASGAHQPQATPAPKGIPHRGQLQAPLRFGAAIVQSQLNNLAVGNYGRVWNRGGWAGGTGYQDNTNLLGA